MDVSSHWSVSQLLHFFGPRLFFAVLCGGLIGLERELKNKPAGIKTNILICLGSALYTSVSLIMATTFSDNGHIGDPSRIAAQIVSGIGFLGGGSIIQSRGTVHGLTTAATIWVVAAVGLCIGLGYPEIAIFSTITVISVLLSATLFEDRILGRSILFTCIVVVEGSVNAVRGAVNESLIENDLVLEDLNLSSHGQQGILTLFYSGHRNDHKKFVLDVWNIPGVREVRQQ